MALNLPNGAPAVPRAVGAAHAQTASAAPPFRVLEFLTVFGCGGTERQVVNLTRMLDRTRFAPQFACLKRWGQFLEEVEQQQIPVAEYRVSSLYRPRTFQQQLRFAASLRRERVQIVHGYNFYANVFAVPAARLAGVPVVIASIRDTGMDITSAKMRVHRIVCRLADCVLVNAEAIRGWLIEQGYPARRIEVIRNGIDLSRFAVATDGAKLRRELGVPADAPLVVVLARLSPQKGFESFLEAAAAVGERRPEVRFLVIGDGFVFSRNDGADRRVVAYRDDTYRGALQRYATRLGIGERVIFTGYRADVPELLAQASVSVLPSYSGEGLPNALMESMAAGVPVVATRVGGSPEIIDRDGVEGLLVPPRNAGALARAIGALLDDADLARRLGAEGKRRVAQCFSLERMVRETENLYAALLDRAMRRSRIRRHFHL